MMEELKDKIAALLPDLKHALEVESENVRVGGVEISRAEAERICKAFEYELNSTNEECSVEWDIIPLKLVVANRNWRSLQESLNQLDKI